MAFLIRVTAEQKAKWANAHAAFPYFFLFVTSALVVFDRQPVRNYRFNCSDISFVLSLRMH